MKKSIKFGVKLINDISAFTYDSQSIKFLSKYNIPFVIQHTVKEFQLILCKKTQSIKTCY